MQEVNNIRLTLMITDTDGNANGNTKGNAYSKLVLRHGGIA